MRPYYAVGEIDIDRYQIDGEQRQVMLAARELDKTRLPAPSWVCLLYTSDAADERSSVDLGGRRIIKKKKKEPVGSARAI